MFVSCGLVSTLADVEYETYIAFCGHFVIYYEKLGMSKLPDIDLSVYPQDNQNKKIECVCVGCDQS